VGESGGAKHYTVPQERDEAERLVGLLTGGGVAREGLTRLAVVMALAPFLNRRLRA